LAKSGREGGMAKFNVSKVMTTGEILIDALKKHGVHAFIKTGDGDFIDYPQDTLEKVAEDFAAVLYSAKEIKLWPTRKNLAWSAGFAPSISQSPVATSAQIAAWPCLKKCREVRMPQPTWPTRLGPSVDRLQNLPLAP